MEDPLAGSPWSRSSTIAGFVTSPPNGSLLDVAHELRTRGARRALDIGCGAGRNTLPLVLQGWRVLGVDLSLPMLLAARARMPPDVSARALFALAPMERLPAADASCDLVIAHGIWNLARSAAQFRAAAGDAARALVPGGTLFVFTFSRSTLASDAQPVAGEPFVFTQFSGEPQCFLTDAQLIAEMAAAGFVPHPSRPLRELNRRAPGVLSTGGPPVIYEAVFVRRGTGT